MVRILSRPPRAESLVLVRGHSPRACTPKVALQGYSEHIGSVRLVETQVGVQPRVLGAPLLELLRRPHTLACTASHRSAQAMRHARALKQSSPVRCTGLLRRLGRVPRIRHFAATRRIGARSRFRVPSLVFADTVQPFPSGTILRLSIAPFLPAALRPTVTVPLRATVMGGLK